MSQKYHNSVVRILNGEVNAVAEETYQQRDALRSTSDETLQRQLLSSRLALKSGNTEIPIDNLDEKRTSNVFLQAEILFVKATYYGMLSQHSFAASAYLKSAECYAQAQSFEREALSRFNHFIAETYVAKTDLKTENAKLDAIIELCQKHGSVRTEFLCVRHRAFRYFEETEYQKAIDSLIAWVARKDALTVSDSHLALLHIADCFVELKDLRKAIQYLDQVPELVDERVRFPKAYVEAKISRSAIDIHSFAVVPSHWRERYENSIIVGLKDKSPKPANILTWCLKTGLMMKNRSLQGKVKAQSLEGQLLRLLILSPRMKSHLCESLWPLEMETEFLDDRFHQLVQRINRKNRGLVVFDGQLYKVSQTIQIRC